MTLIRKPHTPAATAAVLFAPTLALAGTASTTMSFLSSLLQMLASMAIVVGVIYIFYHYANKWSKKYLGQSFQAKHIRLVEKFYIAPRKSLVLVKVGEEHLLLANSEEGLTLIKEVSITEDASIEHGHDAASLNNLRGESGTPRVSFCTTLDATISNHIGIIKGKLTGKRGTSRD